MRKNSSIIILLVVTLVSSAFSQPPPFWPRLLVTLSISNGFQTVYDTLGVDWNSTYCIDPFIDSTLSEIEAPPFIPWNFDAHFIDHRPGSTCFGNGLRLHIQPFGLDTFRLWVNQPNLLAPFQISWSLNNYGLAYWHDLIIGGKDQPLATYLSMRAESTMVVDDSVTRIFDIIGWADIDPVEEESRQVPTDFMLF
jgi:hypothetical protein